MTLKGWKSLALRRLRLQDEVLELADEGVGVEVFGAAVEGLHQRPLWGVAAAVVKLHLVGQELRLLSALGTEVRNKFKYLLL